MDSAREDLRLDIAPQADIVCGALRMCDPDRVLLYDRPLIEVRRHVMSGGTDQFHASGQGLLVGVRALEEIGRASRGERVCQYVSISAVEASFKTTTKKSHITYNQRSKILYKDKLSK